MTIGWTEGIPDEQISAHGQHSQQLFRGLRRPMTTPDEMVESPLDPTELRQTFSCFPSGVTALCARIGGDPVGIAASSFCSVSLEPPLVLICVAKGSATWKQLRAAPRLGISVLSRGHEGLARQLAGAADARFQGVEWSATSGNAVLLEGSAAWLECSLEEEVDAGDHYIAVLRVLSAMRAQTSQPLIFHESRFRELEALERAAESK